jgi:hypothetical protein
MIPNNLKTHHQTTTSGTRITSRKSAQPGSDPPHQSSDDPLHFAGSEEEPWSASLSYDPATGLYTSLLQDFSSQHHHQQASSLGRMQLKKVKRIIACHPSKSDINGGSRLFLSNLKPSQKKFYQSQVQLNHSASNLRFMCVLDPSKNRVFVYHSPSVHSIAHKRHRHSSSEHEPHKNKDLISKVAAPSGVESDSKEPGLLRSRKPLAIKGERVLASSRNNSEQSESDSSRKHDTNQEAGVTGNVRNGLTFEEKIFRSVMTQLRERLMNDKYFSIKELNFLTKRRPAESRVRSTLSAGQTATAEATNNHPTPPRESISGLQETQPHAGEPTGKLAIQPQAPARSDKDRVSEVATQRQPTFRPSIVRMYSIENNLSPGPHKPQPESDHKEISHEPSQHREPTEPPNQAFEFLSSSEQTGAFATHTLGIPQHSHSTLPSPSRLKTVNTLSTNPTTPDHKTNPKRKQFRFIQLIPVPQDGGSSEASPDPHEACQSPLLKPHQADAHSAPSRPEQRPSELGPNATGMQRQPRAAGDAEVTSALESVVDRRSLMELVHQDKQAFQKLTKSIALVEKVSQLDLLSNLACENIGLLLDLRTGNELLQELLRKQHPELIDKLNSFLCPKLERYTSDEVTTKTLYCLAKVSQGFRSRLFAWYGQDLGKNLSSNPKVFLLTSTFKAAHSTDELSPIKAALKGVIHQSYLSSKTFKRFLISYSEYCDESELNRLFRGWNSTRDMLELLNDQYKALALVSILRRKHKSATSLLLKLVRSHLLDLFRTKFFKLLVIRLCNSNRENDLLEQLFLALQRIPQENLDEIARSSSTLYFYLSLMLMTGGPRLAEHLVQLDGALDDFKVVDRMVRLLQGARLGAGINE